LWLASYSFVHGCGRIALTFSAALFQQFTNWIG